MYSFTMPTNRIAGFMTGLGAAPTSPIRKPIVPVIPIAPNLPGTKAGETLPGAGAFTPDMYTTQAAAIEREWSRVIAMQLFRPEDKVERYNTVWNMANALRSKLDIRHPAFQQMTNLQQRINETLRVLGMTTKSVVVKPPVPSLPPPGVKPLTAKVPTYAEWFRSEQLMNKSRFMGMSESQIMALYKRLYPTGAIVIGGPVIGTKPITSEEPGLPPGSIEIPGSGGYKSWRAPNGDIYDQVACFTTPCYPMKRTGFAPAVKPTVTPVVVIPPPIPGQPPPSDATLPVVTETTPITAGFDFGKLLKPPMLYFVIGAAAFLLLGKK